MLQLRSLYTLGGGDHDWRRARHHFAVDSQGHPLPSTRYGYLVPARGRVMVNDQLVGERDGIAIAREPGIAVTAIEPAEIILVDTA